MAKFINKSKQLLAFSIGTSEFILAPGDTTQLPDDPHVANMEAKGYLRRVAEEAKPKKQKTEKTDKSDKDN